MLWMTIIALVALITGGCIIKFGTKMTILGVFLAIVGGITFLTMIVLVWKNDARNAAKCESVTGSYGGDVCYVSGVEKDLKEIGL